MQDLTIAIVSALLGGIVGHWLAIGRDRRKEFNEHASALYKDLETQRITLLDGHYPKVLATLDFCHVRRMLSRQKRAQLDSTLRDYEVAKETCGEYVNGIYVLQQPEVLMQQIDALQSLLPHR